MTTPAELAAAGVEILPPSMGIAQVKVGRGAQKGIHRVSILGREYRCSCGREDCVAVEALKARKRGEYPSLSQLTGLARIDRLASMLSGKVFPRGSRCSLSPEQKAKIETARRRRTRRAWGGTRKHGTETRRGIPRPPSLRVLPLTQEPPGVLVARAGYGFTAHPNGPRAALAIAETEELENTQLPTGMWDWTLHPEEARQVFEERGLAVEIAPGGKGFLARRRREAKFNLTPLDDLPKRYPHRYQAAREKLSQLGWDDVLYEFQARDAAVMSLKGRGFLTYVMGLGKTRTALAAAILACILPQRENRRSHIRHVLIVAESRVIELVWVEELERLGARWADGTASSLHRESNVLAPFTFALVRRIGDLEVQADFHIVSYTGLAQRQVRRDDAACPECKTVHHLACCPKCGKPYPKLKVCPVCGADARSGWTGCYCPRCGHSAHTWVPPLYRRMKGQYSGLIIDEFQLTAHKSLRGQAVRSLKDIPWMWGLSGTPIRNFIGDAFYPLQTALSGRTPGMAPFDYRGGAERWIEAFGAFEEIKEAGIRRKRPLPVIKNEESLWKLLAPWMLRRSLDDPLVVREVELPPLSYRVLGVRGSSLQMQLYRRAAGRFVGWAARERLREERNPDYRMDAGTTLQRLWELRHLATVPSWSPHFTEETWPKMALIKALAEDAVERGRKVIVFSSMLAAVLAVEKRLGKLGVVTVTGNVPIGERPQLVAKWKRDDYVHIFNCTMGTMRLGVTLNADRPITVILANEEWSPATMRQALKRAHRVNTRYPVEAYLVLTEATIDVYIRALVTAKQQAIDLAVDKVRRSKGELLHVPTTREFLDTLIFLHHQEAGDVPGLQALGDRAEVRRLRRLIRTLDITHCEPAPLPAKGLARWKGVRT